MKDGLSKWVRKNRVALVNALFLASEWEETSAQSVLGNTDIYKPDVWQAHSAKQSRKNAKRYNELRDYLNAI